jgi:hypothetical protein
LAGVSSCDIPAAKAVVGSAINIGAALIVGFRNDHHRGTVVLKVSSRGRRRIDVNRRRPPIDVTLLDRRVVIVFLRLAVLIERCRGYSNIGCRC